MCDKPAFRTTTLMNAGAVGVVLFGLTALAVGPLRAAALQCPPRLPGPHPGFEQIGPVPAAHWLLWRMQLFDAPPTKDAPIELAPRQMSTRHDGFIMTWQLKSAGDLLMMCRYDGSETYYRAHPGLPANCTIRNDDGLTQAWCEEP